LEQGGGDILARCAVCACAKMATPNVWRLTELRIKFMIDCFVEKDWIIKEEAVFTINYAGIGGGAEV